MKKKIKSGIVPKPSEKEMEGMNTETTVVNRNERRKLTKKEKRKKKRQELAEIERQLEESRLNDPQELMRLQAEEEIENERIEKERKEFEERERKILEEWERKKALEAEEEERRRKAREEYEQLRRNDKAGYENESDEDGWEYVEEGPPEIIWQGNEIIVKKKKVRVKKTDGDQKITKEDHDRPTSNPLPPQSEAFASHKSEYLPSAQQLLENVANQTPNFGTEQDKAHCPFHLKTGACRFGSHCSRIHFYPDKSCTLLMKNMYNGPGLAWEQDEGLEYTDEEVERAYEDFYEDVHTEFLKFGEIVNFKVCRNGSSHLRGNLYVHYKSLDSAVLAYESINGRYFAGKQVQCEFVSVTRWRVAICGEFMKSKLKTCSRGTACNFIHCFRNPSGDYEWADWDKPPPRYWVQNMVALFGFSDDSAAYDKYIERASPRSDRNSTRTSANDTDRYHSQRSQSRDTEYSRSSRNYSDDDSRSSYRSRHHRHADRKHADVLAVNHRDNRSTSGAKQPRDNASTNNDSDRNPSEWDITTDSPRKRSGAHINRRLDLEPPPAEINVHKSNSGTSGNGRQRRKISKSSDDTDSLVYEEKYLRTEDFEETKEKSMEYSRSSRNHSDDDSRSSYRSRHHRHADRKHADVLAVNHRDNRSNRSNYGAKQPRDNASTNIDSDRNPSEWDITTDSPRKCSGAHSNRRLDLEPPPAEINVHKSDSGTSGNGRQHRKFSKSPDDTDSRVYEEKYLRTEDFEETKEEKSKSNHSRRDGDARDASRDRSYRSYSSRSIKDSGKYEDEDSRRKYKKKSKRKREVEMYSDSDSQMQYHGRKERLREVDVRTGEDRGRWEPD